MLPDAKGSLLTADGHFMRRPSKLATNRRVAIAACRVQNTQNRTGSHLSQRCSSLAPTTLRLEKRVRHGNQTSLALIRVSGVVHDAFIHRVSAVMAHR